MEANHVAVIIACGFSLVAGPLLMLGYFASPTLPKTRLSLVAAAALIAVVSLIQWFHLLFVTSDITPLDDLFYRGALFVAPSLFALFGHRVVAPEQQPRPWLALLFLPTLLPFVLPTQIALPALLLCGAGFALWLSLAAYQLPRARKQYRFELAFSIVITASAAVVLVLGAGLPGIDPALFYTIYTFSIALAYGMVVFAMIAIPDFVADIFELTRTRYRATTLAEVDVKAQLAALNDELVNKQRFRDETLTLTSLAEALGLSSHQLSELINVHAGMSYSALLAEHRVNAAKQQLLSEPNASVLSIGLDVGFRSQSAFYDAFKKQTGHSPGGYRRAESVPE